MDGIVRKKLNGIAENKNIKMEDRKMRHCVLMTVYKDVNMVNEIISHIPDDWGCYVHIDKRSPIEIMDVNPKQKL